MRTALVGLLCRDHRLSLLLAGVDVDTGCDHSNHHNVAGEKLSDAAYQIHSSLANIEEQVYDAAEEVEDCRDQSVDKRGEGANDACEQLIDGLEEVLEGGKELSHLGWVGVKVKLC